MHLMDLINFSIFNYSDILRLKTLEWVYFRNVKDMQYAHCTYQHNKSLMNGIWQVCWAGLFRLSSFRLLPKKRPAQKWRQRAWGGTKWRKVESNIEPRIIFKLAQSGVSFFFSSASQALVTQYALSVSGQSSRQIIKILQYEESLGFIIDQKNRYRMTSVVYTN